MLLIRSVLLVLILIYVGLCLYAYFISERVIFQPPRATYQDTSQILKLQTDDGSHISAIHLPHASATYTILYSHGNAEDLGIVRPVLEEFNRLGFSAFAYDYRGYGTSSGTPSEQGTYRDIQAAYDYLTKHLHIPPQRIIAYGRSLGGAVAVDLASHNRVAGLVIESSFITAFRVLTRVPLLPFDKFRSVEKIKRVHCPVFIMHGTDDEVVAFWHGRKLFDEAHEPKLSLWIEGARHNDFYGVAGKRYANALQRFSMLLDDTNRNEMRK